MADESSTAEKLLLHNQSILVASAGKKVAAGKKLSQREVAAVASAELDAKRKRDLPYIQKMPKVDYIDKFGGAHKLYIEWHQKYGFPWPKGDFVDAIACLRWLRDAFATGGPKASVPDPKKDRIEQIKLRNMELDLEERELKHAERRAKLVNLDEFYRDRFGPGLDRIRVAAERLSPWPQAQLIVEGGIDECIEALQANGSAQLLKAKPKGKKR